MENKIKNFLRTKFLAKDIKFFESLESTQLTAKKMAEETVENGTIVIADDQKKGVGTHDRKWYSEKGKNILFTLIVYPKCNLKKLNTITVDIAKCLIYSIEKIYNIKLDIKSPNDIMYNKKKIGGILTQIVTSGEEIKYLLIGIGINVNQEEFPHEIKDIATSLKSEFGMDFSREKIISEFCNIFEEYCIENNIF